MTSIAIVQPAAPQIPPAGPPASSGSQQFSSHFEKAISEQKEVTTRESGKAKQQDSPQGEEKPAAAPIDKSGKESAPAQTPDQKVAQKDTDIPEEGGTIDKKDPMEELLDALSSEENPALNLLFLALPSDNAAAGANAAVNVQGEKLTFANISAPVLLASSPAPVEMPALAGETPAAAPQTGQKSATDSLLAQLQQLIDQSDEQGTVTITKEDNPSAAVNTAKAVQPQPVWPQQASEVSEKSPYIATNTSQSSEMTAEVIPAEGWNTPVEKSEQTAPLRQNTEQQYYEAKINPKSFDTKEDSLSQDRRQDNEQTAQGQVAAAGQTTSPATSHTVDQTNTFAQTLVTTQTSPSQHTAEAGQTVTLPSGSVVREADVIQQVIERFQLAKKPLDTQINIKLHPAELGELKIDLTVKEGSIRANVVAQSQHAQEIIEKNMPKLRTVLEEQGFTIETITVTAKSDSTADAGMFDRQFFSQSDYTPQTKRRRHEAEAAFRLDEAIFPAQPATTTGVNVKI